MISNQYPSNWKILKLEVALDRISNGLVRSQNKNAEGIPVTRIETIKDEIVDPTRVGYLDNVTDEELQKFKLKTGDILFSHINSEEHIGKSAIYKGNPDIILHGMNLLLLRTNETVCDSLYLNNLLKFYRLKGIFVGLAARAVGQASINQGKMKSLEIPLPPLPEQRAIARALQVVQAARKARLRELALERERKAALMEHLFTHGTRGEATKQTEIGEMPESWQIVRLGEIIVDGPQNGVYKPLELYGEGAPIIRIDDFDNYGSFWNLEFKRVRLSTEEIEKYRANEKDIIINRVNSLSHLGKCALIPKLVEPTVFESNMMRFHVDNEKIIPEFLLKYLVADDNRNRIRNIAKRAVAQSSINQGDVKSLEIPLPLLPEQKEISKVINACDSKIAALDHEAALLDELFRAMLEELMSGRLRADGLVDECSVG